MGSKSIPITPTPLSAGSTKCTASKPYTPNPISISMPRADGVQPLRRKKMTTKAKRPQSTKHKGAGQRVGRGNPPKQTQFRKGTSGNPTGRPKGSKNLSTLIREAANQQVVATINGKQRRISTVQATTLQLATKAASGNQVMLGKFLDWVDEIETRATAAKPAQFPLSAPDVDVLRAAYERMKQCEPENKE